MSEYRDPLLGCAFMVASALVVIALLAGILASELVQTIVAAVLP